MISFSANIHAAPASVRVSQGVPSAVTIGFSPCGGFPEITMFCGNAEMARDLQEAIAAVIAKHAPPADDSGCHLFHTRAA